jgi:hypothetical protein
VEIAAAVQGHTCVHVGCSQLSIPAAITTQSTIATSIGVLAATSLAYSLDGVVDAGVGVEASVVLVLVTVLVLVLAPVLGQAWGWSAASLPVPLLASLPASLSEFCRKALVDGEADVDRVAERANPHRCLGVVVVAAAAVGEVATDLDINGGR